MRQQAKSRVRIIGGCWRSRKIEFLNRPALRPTPDRVRETVFNWLAPSLPGASCLDLFAGSGVLAFEALSRGAARAVLVERDTTICRQLQSQAKLLQADNAIVINQDAKAYIKNSIDVFDIIFLDPPFNSEWINTLAIPPQLLSSHARIYLETAATNHFELPTVWANWDIVHAAKAARVRYLLLQKKPVFSSVKE